MSLEQLTAIAEIAGVVAVVITLAFLSLQIRQNTKALRSASIQSATQTELQLADMLLGHIEVWDKVVTGTPLAAGAEMRTGVGLYNVFMIDTENRFHQYRSGYLGLESWQGRRDALPDLVALPVFRQWRGTVGGRSHSADFLDLLDGMVDEGNA